MKDLTTARPARPRPSSGTRRRLRTRVLALATTGLLPLILSGCGAAYVIGAILLLQDDDNDVVNLTQVDVFPTAVSAPTTAQAEGNGGGALDPTNPNENVTELILPVRTRGVSVSATNPITDLVNNITGTTLVFEINGEQAQIQVDPFDPARPLDTGERIAAAIEREVRALTATVSENQTAFAGFTAVFDEEAERFELRTGFGQEGDLGPDESGISLEIQDGPGGDDLADALLLGDSANGTDEFSEWADISLTIVNRGNQDAADASVKLFLSRDKTLSPDDILFREYFVDVREGETVIVGVQEVDSLAEFQSLGDNALPEGPIPIDRFVTNDVPARLDPFFQLIVNADELDATLDNNVFTGERPIQVYPAPDGGVGNGTDLVFTNVNGQTAALADGVASVQFTILAGLEAILADETIGVTFFLSNDRILDEPLDPFNPDRDAAGTDVAEDVPLAFFLLEGTLSEVAGTGGLELDFTVAGNPVLSAADIIGQNLVLGAESRNGGTREAATIVAFDDQGGNPHRVTIDAPYSVAAGPADEASVVGFEAQHVFRLNAPLVQGGARFGAIGDRRTFDQNLIIPSLADNLLPEENDATDLNTFFLIGRITSTNLGANDPDNDASTSVNYMRVYGEDQFVLLGGIAFPQTFDDDPTVLDAVNNQEAQDNVLGKGEQRLLQFDIPDDFSQLFIACESLDFDPSFELLSATGTRFGFSDDTALGRTAVTFQPLEAPGGQKQFLLVVSPTDPASADVNAQGSAFNILISANPNDNVAPIVLGEFFGIGTSGGADESFSDVDAAGTAFRVSRKVVPISLPQRQRQLLLLLTEDTTRLGLQLTPDFPEAVDLVLTAVEENSGQIVSVVPVPVFQADGSVLFLFDPPDLNQFKLFDAGSIILTFESNVPVNEASDLIIDVVYQPR